MGEGDRTNSTTFTYNEETERFLHQAYPDAIGLNEALRNAVQDARKVHRGRLVIDGIDDVDNE